MEDYLKELAAEIVALGKEELEQLKAHLKGHGIVVQTSSDPVSPPSGPPPINNGGN